MKSEVISPHSFLWRVDIKKKILLQRFKVDRVSENFLPIHRLLGLITRSETRGKAGGGKTEFRYEHAREKEEVDEEKFDRFLSVRNEEKKLLNFTATPSIQPESSITYPSIHFTNPSTENPFLSVM